MHYNSNDGSWELTLPFPSGTFQYSFLVNCVPPVIFCTGTVDPENPPIEALAGEQTSSIIQVPFDAKRQIYNYDWQLPLANMRQRGTVNFYNYSSPGATYPAQNVHSVGVYLPSGYSNLTCYPVAYFHHGCGGNHADWFNQGRLQNILDRLIATRIIPPVVVVTPSFYNLGFTPEQYATNDTNYHYTNYDQIGLYAFDSQVRQNYFKYLMPWVESTFSVARDPEKRAFVGLSMGGGLATEMLFNATDYFHSYGIFSQVPFMPPVPNASVSAFASKKLLLGAGKYDFALPSTPNAQTTLAQAGVRQIQSWIPRCGGHSWCVWQELAYIFLRDVWEVSAESRS
jgi:enterochelin esterase-like enzyme